MGGGGSAPRGPTVAMISPPLGDYNAGTKYDFTCPNGTYIRKINGNENGVIRGYQAECSDGTKSQWFGGRAGNPFTDISNDGYKGLEMARVARLIDGIQLKYANGNAGPYIGGPGGDPVPSFTCTAGKVTRLFGSATPDQLYSMHMECDELIAPPYSNVNTTAQPISNVYTAPPPIIYQPVQQPQPTAQPISNVYNYQPVQQPQPQPQPTATTNTKTTTDTSQKQSGTDSDAAKDTEPEPEKKSYVWVYVLIFIFIIMIIIIITIVVVASSKKKNNDE